MNKLSFEDKSSIKLIWYEGKSSICEFDMRLNPILGEYFNLAKLCYKIVIKRLNKVKTVNSKFEW